jgi:hypothetical protein
LSGTIAPTRSTIDARPIVEDLGALIEWPSGPDGVRPRSAARCGAPSPRLHRDLRRRRLGEPRARHQGAAEARFHRAAERPGALAVDQAELAVSGERGVVEELLDGRARLVGGEPEEVELARHVLPHGQRHGPPGRAGPRLGDGLDLAPRHLHREMPACR